MKDDKVYLNLEVWNTAKNDLPSLKIKLEEILSS